MPGLPDSVGRLTPAVERITVVKRVRPSQSRRG